MRPAVGKGRAPAPQRPALPAGALARRPPPSWATGGSLAGARASSPRALGTATLAPAPGSPPRPFASKAAPPPGTLPRAVSGTHERPLPALRTPRGPRLPPPAPRTPRGPPPRAWGARPLPRTSPAEARGEARGSDPGEARRPRPPVRRVTGRAGSSSRRRGHRRRGGARGVGPGCRASRSTPGGRYLVGGHRAEALEDGQDVLLAGVPHSHQRTGAQLPSQPGRADPQRLPPPGA